MDAEVSTLDVVVALTQVQGPDSQRRWRMQGRITHVQTRVTSEKALVGAEVVLLHEGSVLPGLPLRTGLLCRATISLEEANLMLDQVAELQESPLEVRPSAIRPMNEPCARVPLSLFRELRGQESNTEMSRRALVKVWSEDRRLVLFRLNQVVHPDCSGNTDLVVVHRHTQEEPIVGRVVVEGLDDNGVDLLNQLGP